jgi:uncharacterized protein
MTDVTTHLLVDGENIDATLGNSILGGRPAPEQRPRWDTVRQFVADHWGSPTNALFFLNASSGSIPMSFVQALHAMDYRVVPLSGEPHEKVVDMAILATLEALKDRPGHVMLASHDGDFADKLLALVDDERKVGIIGFPEFVSQTFRVDERIEFLDLEDDARAFTVALPRMRIIPIAEFDPTRFL